MCSDVCIRTSERQIEPSDLYCQSFELWFMFYAKGCLVSENLSQYPACITEGQTREKGGTGASNYRRLTLSLIVVDLRSISIGQILNANNSIAVKRIMNTHHLLVSTHSQRIVLSRTKKK